MKRLLQAFIFFTLIIQTLYAKTIFGCIKDFLSLSRSSEVYHRVVYPKMRWMPERINYTEQKLSDFDLIGQEKGRFDYIYHLRKRDTWEPEDEGPDYQGNPLNVLLAFSGFNQKQLLGFERIDERTLKYPSASELILRYKEIQNKFPKHFHVNFYVEPPKKSFRLKTYLERFAYQNELPLGSRDNQFIHDINWHFVTALAIPTQFWEAYRHKVRLFLDFELFLASEYPYEYSIHKKFINTEMMNRMVTAVDYFTGRLGSIVATYTDNINIDGFYQQTFGILGTGVGLYDEDFIRHWWGFHMYISPEMLKRFFAGRKEGPSVPLSSRKFNKLLLKKKNKLREVFSSSDSF